MIFCIVMQLIDLCFLSQPQRVAPWFRFACVLETFFWLHLFVRIIAVGVRRFVSFYENRGDTLLNIFSLIAIIKLGSEYYSKTYDFENSLSMGWYLLFQCGRLFKLFFAVNDVKIFEHMRPVLIRASFIYFSIIYFFAIFGYSYFCHALNVEDATNTSESNDANQWVQYSNLLNFNTLLQSMFTLFEVSILGNWSIVMDAAVVSTNKPASAYIFFYTYRLVITLFILPILLSFIIQVFLSALSMREKELAEEAVADQRQHSAQQARRSSASAKRAYSDDELSPTTTRFSLGGMGVFSSSPFTSTLFMPGANTKVSYNVNQEVLVLGHQGSVAASHPSHSDGHHSDGHHSGGNPEDSERDTEESETLSPLASKLPHLQHGGGTSASTNAANTGGNRSSPLRPDHSDRSGSPTPHHKKWPHFSMNVKLDVDKQAATNARDKYSESIPSVKKNRSLAAGGASGVGGGSGSPVRGSDMSSVQSAQSVDHRSVEGHSHASLNSMQSVPSSDRSPATPGSSPRAGAGVGASGRHTAGYDQSKVTVQYDSKAGSSMMSIWTIGDNIQPVSSKAVSSKTQGSPVNTGASQRSPAHEEISHLQAQLQAALQALNAERAKNKALSEHTNVM